MMKQNQHFTFQKCHQCHLSTEGSQLKIFIRLVTFSPGYHCTLNYLVLATYSAKNPHFAWLTEAAKNLILRRHCQLILKMGCNNANKKSSSGCPWMSGGLDVSGPQLTGAVAQTPSQIAYQPRPRQAALDGVGETHISLRGHPCLNKCMLGPKKKHQ